MPDRPDKSCPAEAAREDRAPSVEAAGGKSSAGPAPETGSSREPDSRIKPSDGAGLWGMGLRFYRTLRSLTGVLILSYAVIAVSAAVDQGRLFFVKDIFDHLNPEGFRTYGPILIGMSLGAAALNLLKEWIAGYVQLRVIYTFRSLLAQKLLALPLSFFHQHKSGDVLSRITNDVMALDGATRFYFDEIWVSTFQILVPLGIAFWHSWQLAAGALLLIPLLGIPLRLAGRRLWRTRRRSYEYLGEATESLVQIYGGIKTIKAYGMETFERHVFEGRYRGFMRKALSSIRARALAESLVDVVAACIVLGLILSADKFFALGLTAGQMITCAGALGVMLAPIRTLTRSYNRCMESLGAAQRVFYLLDEAPESPDFEGASDPGPIESVEFRDVVFSYDQEPLLRGVSFSARAGEIVAIVGKSGAGKSTLMDLLMKFYEPESGSILINGRDIRGLRRKSLLGTISLSAQEPFLFNSTVLENIQYGDPNASSEEIREACRLANLTGFIAGQPLGIETNVGDRGSAVSGGEKQRIGLARALVRRPGILILDEPTSQLDGESERLVQEAVENITREKSAKRVTFVIAHRLSTVQNADQILVLQDGRIAESGTHRELLGRNGLYSSLFKTQVQGAQV